jgi:hypothetical protein
MKSYVMAGRMTKKLVSFSTNNYALDLNTFFLAGGDRKVGYIKIDCVHSSGDAIISEKLN